MFPTRTNCESAIFDPLCPCVKQIWWWKECFRLKIHLPRPAQVESKMHSMRPIPAEDGQIGDPIQKHQVEFHYQLVMLEYDSLYWSFWHITYINSKSRVYLATQHPINRMTPWHKILHIFTMLPLLAIDQVQMLLQWLSLVSLAYQLLPAHPNQLLSLPAMPPRLFFRDVFSSRISPNLSEFRMPIIDVPSLVSWRQLLQLSSKAQSLDTMLNETMIFHLTPSSAPSPKSGTCTCS